MRVLLKDKSKYEIIKLLFIIYRYIRDITTYILHTVMIILNIAYHIYCYYSMLSLNPNTYILDGDDIISK